MLSRSGRPLAQVLFGPVARACVKAGISADAITIIGTCATVILSLTLLPTNHILIGAILIAVVVIFDNLDGQIARLTGTASQWGAFLDSTLDRIADGAIFAGLLVWAYLHAQDATKPWLLLSLLAALVLGSVVPYARARAESVGVDASVGIAERADRIVIMGLSTILVGAGITEWILVVAASYLALASCVTIIQRMACVWREKKVSSGQVSPEETAGQ